MFHRSMHVHPIWPSYCVYNYSQKEMGVIVDNCRPICSCSCIIIIIIIIIITITIISWTSYERSPKMQRLRSLTYGRWSHTRIGPHEASSKNFMECILLHIISKLHHVLCFMLVLKFFIYSKYYSAHSEHREIRELLVKWLLTRG